MATKRQIIRGVLKASRPKGPFIGHAIKHQGGRRKHPPIFGGRKDGRPVVGTRKHPIRKF